MKRGTNQCSIWWDSQIVGQLLNAQSQEIKNQGFIFIMIATIAITTTWTKNSLPTRDQEPTSVAKKGDEYIRPCLKYNGERYALD